MSGTAPTLQTDDSDKITGFLIYPGAGGDWYSRFHLRDDDLSLYRRIDDLDGVSLDSHKSNSEDLVYRVVLERDAVFDLDSTGWEATREYSDKDPTALLTFPHNEAEQGTTLPPHADLLAQAIQQADGITVSRQDFGADETVYKVSLDRTQSASRD